MTRLAGLKVLVVEDEAAVAMLIEDMMEDLGCEVVDSIASLAQACEVAAVTDAQFAILDMNISGEMIFPVAHILRERQIPFLFSTGYGASGLPAEFLEYHVLPKPFSQNTLEEKLALAVGQ